MPSKIIGSYEHLTPYLSRLNKFPFVRNRSLAFKLQYVVDSWKTTSFDRPKTLYDVGNQFLNGM